MTKPPTPPVRNERECPYAQVLKDKATQLHYRMGADCNYCMVKSCMHHPDNVQHEGFAMNFIPPEKY